MKKKGGMMTTYNASGGFLYLILIALFAGCATQSVDTNGRQADIGLSIVEGTKGYRQIQNEKLALNKGMRQVKGQVFQIEGAAYVVHMNDRIDVRLPVDENTRIDRPAHIGDWIEAQLDQDGRARTIRNIDDLITLE
jgi:hypothetical protein